MDEQALSNTREKIRRKMQGYRSLPEYLLDGVGALARNLTRFPKTKRESFLPKDATAENDEIPSYWVNGLIIMLLTFLVGWLTSLILQESLSEDELWLSVWAASAGALALVASKANMRLFLKTFRGPILEKVQSAADADDLGNWLESNFIAWKPLLVGLIFGPGLAFILYKNWQINTSATMHIGPIVVVVLACIQTVWVAYYLLPFYVELPSRLSRYKFDLYTTDPSSSEVIGRLSKLLTSIMYITIAYIVLLTIGLTEINVLDVNMNLDAAVVFAVFVWAPTVLLYAAGQMHISDVISKAKWDVLNEVQTKIESLYAIDDIPQKETLERLERLMDHHDRIKNTPNSALNFRSGLNFLNSLLLPVLAFLLANIGDLIEWIK